MVDSPVSANFITDMRLLMVDSGIRLLAAIFILTAGWIIATWVKRWLSAGLQHLPLDLTLKPLLASLMRYAILIITVILVLEQFGVQTTSLIAVIGAAGLAVGLALQGTLSNIAAGVMLLVLRPFRVGHFVQIGGQSGTVREIGLFTTIMSTRDLVYVSVPNSAVFSGVITNYTREPLRRIKFTLPVDPVNDLSTVERVIVEALKSDSHVAKAPAPWVGVSELGDYAVILAARCFVRSEDYWRALASVQKTVKDALDRAEILIAVPRQAPAVRLEPAVAKNTPPSPK
ncbi:MAG TPA: mechanosensitive ion channel domain-containing protein [Rhizomicrobium sp.]